MRTILTTVACMLASGAALAGDAALLVYRVWETGIDPYASRILVTPAYLRLDEGRDDGSYSLFDRQQEILYTVSPEDRSVMVMHPAGPVPGEPAGLILHEEVETDERAPTVAGHRPTNVRLFANGELCSEMVVLDGAMDDAVEALTELKLALARVQARSLADLPLSARTPCDLAANVYAADRPLSFGLPIQERSAGRSQSLVDFTPDFDADDTLFEIPQEFSRRPMFAPGAI